jgi:hypothetical protein
MPKLWIGSLTASDAELRSLSEALSTAMPQYEPQVDERMLVGLPVPREPPPLTATGWVADAVALLLPAVTGAIVKTAVDVAVDWLRAVVKPERQKLVLIYGPDGEQLRVVRFRGSTGEPEVFKPPWPTLEKLVQH